MKLFDNSNMKQIKVLLLFFIILNTEIIQTKVHTKISAFRYKKIKSNSRKYEFGLKTKRGNDDGKDVKEDHKLGYLDKFKKSIADKSEKVLASILPIKEDCVRFYDKANFEGDILDICGNTNIEAESLKRNINTEQKYSFVWNKHSTVVFQFEHKAFIHFEGFTVESSRTSWKGTFFYSFS